MEKKPHQENIQLMIESERFINRVRVRVFLLIIVTTSCGIVDSVSNLGSNLGDLINKSSGF